MLTSERKAVILQRLQCEGRVVAKDLARELAISEDTIRRDLRELATQGRLQRVHGGALPASPAMADFSRRQSLATEGKSALARRAAELIEPRQLVLLDGGTTNVLLARSLPPDLEITVVTHSPSIAVELAAHPTIEVELIGGRLFKHSIVAVGAATANAIRRVRPNLFVMGVTGLHPDMGASTGNAEEAEIKATFAAQSAETMVLATEEKVGAVSPYVIAPVGDLTTILLSRTTSPRMTEALRECGPEIILV